MDILIQDGKAHNLYPDGAPPLHPSIEVVKSYAGQVEEGWEWNGSTFTAPPPVPEPVDNRTAVEKRRAEYPTLEELIEDLEAASILPATTLAKLAALRAKYPD